MRSAGVTHRRNIVQHGALPPSWSSEQWSVLNGSATSSRKRCIGDGKEVEGNWKARPACYQGRWIHLYLVPLFCEVFDLCLWLCETFQARFTPQVYLFLIGGGLRPILSSPSYRDARLKAVRPLNFAFDFSIARHFKDAKHGGGTSRCRLTLPVLTWYRDKNNHGSKHLGFLLMRKHSDLNKIPKQDLSGEENYPRLAIQMIPLFQNSFS